MSLRIHNPVREFDCAKLTLPIGAAIEFSADPSPAGITDAGIITNLTAVIHVISAALSQGRQNPTA